MLETRPSLPARTVSSDCGKSPRPYAEFTFRHPKRTIRGPGTHSLSLMLLLRTARTLPSDPHRFRPVPPTRRHAGQLEKGTDERSHRCRYAGGFEKRASSLHHQRARTAQGCSRCCGRAVLSPHQCGSMALTADRSRTRINILQELLNTDTDVARLPHAPTATDVWVYQGTELVRERSQATPTTRP